MGDITLSIPDLEEEQVGAIVAGLSVLQMQALKAGDIPKVEAAGSTISVLAEENPDAVRGALLRNQESFRIAQMPDEMLDHLDLELRDGQLYRPDGDDGWTEVEIGATEGGA